MQVFFMQAGSMGVIKTVLKNKHFECLQEIQKYRVLNERVHLK